MQEPVVVRFGALGDMVMITPLLRLLAQRAGRPCRVIGSGAWTTTLFDHCPWVCEVSVIRSRKTPYLLSSEQRRLVSMLRHQSGPVWLLEGPGKAERLLARAGKHSTEHCFAAANPRAIDEHTVLHWLRLGLQTPASAAAFQAAAEDQIEPGTQLHVTDSEQAACRTWLAGLGAAERPLVLIQPGSKKVMKGGRRDRASNLKYWPETHWRSVIAALCAQDPACMVLICGAPSEQDLARELAAGFAPERVRAVADQLPLRRLLALMTQATSCISVDTGPAHVAAALDLPLVVLFGATDPRLYRPLSRQSPVEIVSARPLSEIGPGPEAWAAANTMQGISVPSVIAAWARVHRMQR